MSVSKGKSWFGAGHLALVGGVAAIGGFWFGQHNSQQDFDAGYRRALEEIGERRAEERLDAGAVAADAAAAARDAAAAAAEAVSTQPVALDYGNDMLVAESERYRPEPRYYSGENFRGMPCTEDCSGHEAGYAWAEENEITDPDVCGGHSNSFIEGCIAWAEENY